jgi:PAS domain S-box-containing protein
MRDNGPQTEVLLRMLAEQTTEHAIILLDCEGRIAWWNRGAREIFGQPSAVLFPPEDVAGGIPEHEIAVAESDGAAQDDRWMSRRDGSRFWATGALTAVRDAKGQLLGFGKILRNRTDLREQLETLKNQVEASAAVSNSKDLFLSTLSHELRNPLAPLTNAVHLIRATAPPTPELEYPLKIIERQVDSIRRLVDDLLDLSRIGAGKVELKKVSTPIHEILHRATESAAPLIRERRHKLEMLLPRAPILVEGDPHRLEQVFVNLINNSAKYTPEGGRIWVKGTTEGDEAVVHIEDDGIGIPHGMLPHIFELFTQVESARSQSQGGLGIGLSLVKNLVTLHGGSVQVRSDGPGKGSEFSVRLPLRHTGAQSHSR